MGQQRTAKADENSAHHRRERSGIRQQEDGLVHANTANDTIVKIPVNGPTLEPGTPEVFVNRIGGGRDGLLIDEHDNLWVACNQSNEILVLEPTQGRVVAKPGDFGGIDRNGAPIGFLWSNSLVFHGDDVLGTTLSLDVETAIAQLADELGLGHLVGRNLRTIDVPWARRVKVHTILIQKRIPEPGPELR